MIMCADASGAHVKVMFRQYLGAEPASGIAFCGRSQRVAVAAGAALAVMHLSRAGRWLPDPTLRAPHSAATGIRCIAVR